MLAVLSLSGAYAQKNSVLLFGYVTGSNSSSSTTLQESINSSVGGNFGFGYQLSNHFTVGALGYYNRSAFETNQLITPAYTTHSVSTSYSVGIFGRYTYYLGERLFVYLQADANYGQAKGKVTNTQTPNTTESTSSGPITANLTPAVGCFIYKGWAVNLNIGHIGYRYQSQEGQKSSGFNYNLGNTLSIGVSKNFIRKAKPQTQIVQ